MRLIDADVLKMKLASLINVAKSEPQKALLGRTIFVLNNMPTIDAIPVDWMLQRMNETASGAGLNVALNNALFTVGVEWERWKKEHGQTD